MHCKVCGKKWHVCTCSVQLTQARKQCKGIVDMDGTPERCEEDTWEGEYCYLHQAVAVNLPVPICQARADKGYCKEVAVWYECTNTGIWVLKCNFHSFNGNERYRLVSESKTKELAELIRSNLRVLDKDVVGFLEASGL